jgi:hypothetical protein
MSEFANDPMSPASNFNASLALRRTAVELCRAARETREVSARVRANAARLMAVSRAYRADRPGSAGIVSPRGGPIPPLSGRRPPATPGGN